MRLLNGEFVVHASQCKSCTCPLLQVPSLDLVLAEPSVKVSDSGNGRLHVKGHASVFNSPSVELQGRYGNFVETISHHAFDTVLRTQPDVLLTWDHNTLYPLARTTAGNHELSVNAHGLRFFASCTPTSYAEDLRSLMADGVVSEASFLFSVAEDGQDWQVRDGVLHRTITNVGNLYDVCVCASGAYPGADSEIARSIYLNYALAHSFIATNPDGALRKAQKLAELRSRRRKLAATARSPQGLGP
jgi:HK97 family phage prohead protease